LFGLEFVDFHARFVQPEWARNSERDGG
jgi:hypothetical protein